MSIINAQPTYPPGYGGNPYTPNQIGVFYDMNWPDAGGIKSTGFTAPGLLGLGDSMTCVSWDEAGACDGWDTSITSGLPEPITTPITPLTITPSGGDLSSYFSSLGITASNTAPASVTLTPSQQAAFTQKLTPVQQAQLISAIGNSAVSLVRTASGGPYTVAGTNLVYNPATGALTNAGGGLSTALNSQSINSMLPYLAIAGVALLLLMGKK